MGLLDDYPHVSILDADDIVKKKIREGLRNGIIDAGLENNFYALTLTKCFKIGIAKSRSLPFFRSMCTLGVPIVYP